MPKPLSHSGETAGQIIHRGGNVVGELVYVGGRPQVIGIVRDFLGSSRGYGWDAKVLVEWMSGVKVWKSANSVMTVKSKLLEEERAYQAIKLAQSRAQLHFGV